MTTALRQVGRSAVRIDRAQVTVDVAVRATIGVVLPLIVFSLADHPQVGAAASVGALQGGFASFQGSYRSRAGVVVATCVGMSLSVFVGATVGHVVGIDIVVVGAAGFLAGMLVSLGQSAATVGLQSVVLLMVYSQFKLTPAAAAREAGIVFLGGLLQILLIVVVWPFRRYPAERRALGNVYAQLAENARRIALDQTDFWAPTALAGLGPILSDPQPFGRTVEMAAHNALANQADRIHLELTALARAKQRLYDSGNATQLRPSTRWRACPPPRWTRCPAPSVRREAPRNWRPIEIGSRRPCTRSSRNPGIARVNRVEPSGRPPLARRRTTGPRRSPASCELRSGLPRSRPAAIPRRSKIWRRPAGRVRPRGQVSSIGPTNSSPP